jgi:transcriptional regulator of NAD metabolism
MVLRDVVGISIEHWCMNRRTTRGNFSKKIREEGTTGVLKGMGNHHSETVKTPYSKLFTRTR